MPHTAFSLPRALLLGGACLPAFVVLVALTAPPCAAQAGAGPEASSPPVSGAEAIDAMKQAMQARGLTPPPGGDLSLDDYIETDADASGTRHVKLWIGPDGRVIPTPEWRTFRPNYCKRKARYMRGAGRMLDFEVFRHTESHDGAVRNQLTVFARLSDMETGMTVEQREGEASNLSGAQVEGEGYVADALEAAFAKMKRTPKAPTSPCGEVRLKHVSGQKVGEPFVFRAGFRGFGKALVYTWDFGDGSAPAEGRSLQRPQHVYNAGGTYEVSVRVRQMDGQAHTGTISVEVGEEAGLALFFSSRIEMRPSGEHVGTSQYEASFALMPGDSLSVYEGAGPLRNVDYSHAMTEMGCEIRPLDGVWKVQVTLPKGGRTSPEQVEAVLGFTDPEAVPSTDADCGLIGAVVDGIAEVRIWYTGFAFTHEGEWATQEGAWIGMRLPVSHWEQSSDPDVIARKVYNRRSSNFIEETTIEIRRTSP